MSEPTSDHVRVIQQGLELPDEKQIYFNGYSVLIAGVDISLALRKNDKTLALLNVPHSVAKSLAITLLDLLDDFEKKSGHAIPTLAEIESNIVKNLKSNDPTK